MRPLATRFVETIGLKAPSGTVSWRTLGRHQLGSIAATMVDFGAMILCVEALGLPPVVATVVGATLGGGLNFALGRIWIFRRQAGRLSGQAARYALVSGGGALWNALGVHLLSGLAHVQYILARALVAIVVSLLWNFPMQRHFVFQEGRGR